MEDRRVIFSRFKNRSLKTAQQSKNSSRVFKIQDFMNTATLTISSPYQQIVQNRRNQCFSNNFLCKTKDLPKLTPNHFLMDLSQNERHKQIKKLAMYPKMDRFGLRGSQIILPKERNLLFSKNPLF